MGQTRFCPMCGSKLDTEHSLQYKGMYYCTKKCQFEFVMDNLEEVEPFTEDDIKDIKKIRKPKPIKQATRITPMEPGALSK